MCKNQGCPYLAFESTFGLCSNCLVVSLREEKVENAKLRAAIALTSMSCHTSSATNTSASNETEVANALFDNERTIFPMAIQTPAAAATAIATPTLNTNNCSRLALDASLSTAFKTPSRAENTPVLISEARLPKNTLKTIGVEQTLIPRSLMPRTTHDDTTDSPHHSNNDDNDSMTNTADDNGVCLDDNIFGQLSSTPGICQIVKKISLPLIDTKCRGSDIANYYGINLHNEYGGPPVIYKVSGQSELSESLRVDDILIELDGVDVHAKLSKDVLDLMQSKGKMKSSILTIFRHERSPMSDDDSSHRKGPPGTYFDEKWGYFRPNKKNYGRIIGVRSPLRIEPPKKMNSFQLFGSDPTVLEDIKLVEGSNISAIKVQKIKSKRWKELPDDERNYWVKKARECNDRFTEDMESYKLAVHDRNLSGYMFYYKTSKNGVMRDFPHYQIVDAVNQIWAMFKALPVDERMMWNDMADDIVKRLGGISGFHFFCRSQKKQFRIDYPPTTTSGYEVRRMITNKWNEMTNDDKKPWLDLVMRESFEKLNNEDSLAWIDATSAHPDNPNHNASTRPRRNTTKMILTMVMWRPRMITLMIANTMLPPVHDVKLQ